MREFDQNIFNMGKPKETYFKCFPNETNIWLHYWQCCLTKHISFYIADVPHRAVTVIRVRLSILYFILLKLYTILPEWGDPQGNRRHYKCQCLAGHLANGDLFCQILTVFSSSTTIITSHWYIIGWSPQKINMMQ